MEKPPNFIAEFAYLGCVKFDVPPVLSVLFQGKKQWSSWFLMMNHCIFVKSENNDYQSLSNTSSVQQVLKGAPFTEFGKDSISGYF